MLGAADRLTGHTGVAIVRPSFCQGWRRGMIRFDFFTLKLFVAVGEELAIAKAAEREGIVASAASKRIADLESTLGTPLLPAGTPHPGEDRHGSPPFLGGAIGTERADRHGCCTPLKGPTTLPGST